MKINLPIIILSILLFGCQYELDNINPENKTEKLTDYNNVEYKIIVVEPGDNLNDLIEDNTLLQLGKDKDIYEINSDLIINNKKNVIIEGGGSILNFIEDKIRIQIYDSENIILRDLFVDNIYQGDTTRAGNLNNNPFLPTHEGRIHSLRSKYVKLSNLTINEQKTLGYVNNETIHQILFEETSYSEVKNSNVDESDGELIYLKSSAFCTIENNLLNRGWSGIGTSGAIENNIAVYGHDNKIIGNTVTNSTTAYITINDKRALIESNLIYSDSPIKNGGPGIRFGHKTGEGEDHKFASEAICRNNIIRDLLVANPNYTSMGITVDYTQANDSNKDYTNLIIENNKIINCETGVNISNQPGQYLTIRNNEISSTSGYAITIFSKDKDDEGNSQQFEPQHSLIQDNILYSGNEVFRAYNSSIILSGNYLFSSSSNNSVSCIKIQNMYDESNGYPNDVKILDNVIKLNGASGIKYDANALNNALIKNNIIENGYYGIYFGGQETIIDNNVIRDCSFRSIYIRYGALNTTIADNHIYNGFECAVYLNATSGTDIFNNKFNYTNGIYSFAVWKSGNVTNDNITSNILKNFAFESN